MKILPINRFHKIKFTNKPSNNVSSKTKGLKKEQERQEILSSLITDLYEDTFAAQTTSVAQLSGSFDKFKTEIEEIKKALSVPNPKENNKNEEIIEDFFKRMKELNAQNKGFKRISGYNGIKEYLKKTFVFNSMLREKTSLGATIPNAYLFFGPTGCGKTTFALALAEQSLSNILYVTPDNREPKEIMDEIIKKAQIAKESYEKSKDKTRTIILLNEFDTIAYQDSPIVDDLVKFLSNCADKYKCTLFLTTNFPLDIDEKILSKDVIPEVVAVPPADRETAKQIIENHLQKTGKPLMTTDKILDELFSKNSQYSNVDIIDIINYVLLETKYPEEDDILREIKKGRISPHLNSNLLARFENEKNFFGVN